jgi:hypothetical protein
MESTHPLKMSTRNTPGGKDGRCVRVTNFTTFIVPKVEKIRSLNLPDLQGPAQACSGKPLPLPLLWYVYQKRYLCKCMTWLWHSNNVDLTGILQNMTEHWLPLLPVSERKKYRISQIKLTSFSTNVTARLEKFSEFEEYLAKHGGGGGGNQIYNLLQTKITRGLR